MRITIYYDGQCPFCRNYILFAAVSRRAANLHLVDLRESREDRLHFEAQGYNPDEGMIVDADGEIYYGKNAAKFLSRFVGDDSLINKLNRWVFHNAVIAGVIYHLMKMGRRLTLLVNGRSALSSRNNVYANALTLFCFLYAIFSILHFLPYAFQFGVPLYPSTYVIPILGAALVFKSDSRRLFFLLVVVQLADAVMHVPMTSNHTLLKNALLLAVVLAGIYAWVKDSRLDSFYCGFATVGRCLLLTMYFFGVFHKLNNDFLNPAVSCVASLWREMPIFFSYFHGNWVTYVGIMATLGLEILIVIFLLVRATRHWGVVLGIAFHSLLALSGYALYAPFSMLTICLHILFISPAGADSLLTSSRWRALKKNLQTLRYRLAMLAAILLMIFLAWNGAYSAVGTIWFLLMIPVFRLILGAGNEERPYTFKELLLARPLVLNVLSVLFFLNCFAPYWGLKTAQTMSMFANLRLEGGQSNHLIMTDPPGPFGYLEDIVSINAGGGIRFLEYAKSNELGLVYYHLLDQMERNPSTKVSYFRNGELLQNISFNDLTQEDKEILHPRWFRAWFHFHVVDTINPKPCALDR